MPFGFASDSGRRNTENLARRKQRCRLDAHGRLNVGGAGEGRYLDEDEGSPEAKALRAAADARAKTRRCAGDRRDVLIGGLAICIAALVLALLSTQI